MININRRNTDI